MLGLLILALFSACFSMIASRVSMTVLTAPMIFIAFGYLLSTTGWTPQIDAEKLLHLVAEIALIVLLFLDAAQINIKALRERHTWPLRMLAIGLPLTILLGTFAAMPFLPGWPLVAVALVAAILAPTDAALGQAVVSNHEVPERVRHGLTVESGLNDGLALPVVLLFASLIASNEIQGGAQWLAFAGKQLLLGPLAGAAIGWIGGRLFLLAHKHELTSETYEGIGALSLAGAAYLAAIVIGGNGFIAAFVGGLVFGNIIKGSCRFIYEFTESEGQLLTWGAFFLLGLALVPSAVQHLTWPMLSLILVSLFIVRPLAIWLSLMGTDASLSTKLFFGLFGPRGLATALFALLIVPMIEHDLAEQVLFLAVNAVWISALLHGLSAVPAANWYARHVGRNQKAPEMMPVEDPAKPMDSRMDSR